MFTKEMMAALEADGEKLRQITGEEHGPVFPVMEATDDLATSEELLEIFDGGHDPETEGILASGKVAVCDGEWRREPDGRWRFWKHQDE